MQAESANGVQAHVHAAAGHIQQSNYGSSFTPAYTFTAYETKKCTEQTYSHTGTAIGKCTNLLNYLIEDDVQSPELEALHKEYEDTVEVAGSFTFSAVDPRYRVRMFQGWECEPTAEVQVNGETITAEVATKEYSSSEQCVELPFTMASFIVMEQ